MNKLFHISDILTVTTGRLVSTRHMDGVYEILNYMTGDDLFTHQLPGATRICKKELLIQYPQLSDVEVRDFLNKEDVFKWVDLMVIKYGETLPVTPLESWNHKDPIDELKEIRKDAQIITVIT
jgi:hypothetical protein